MHKGRRLGNVPSKIEVIHKVGLHWDKELGSKPNSSLPIVARLPSAVYIYWLAKGQKNRLKYIGILGVCAVCIYIGPTCWSALMSVYAKESELPDLVW